MTKTIKLGKIDYLGTGKKNCPVELEIRFDKTQDGFEFAASGTIWNHIHTDCYCAGQCLDTIANFIHTDQFKEIYRLWKLYHLNGFHAGSPKQEEFLKNNPTNDYTEACKKLEEVGLLIDNSYLHKGEPYKYGTAWLFQEIPAEDVEKIRKIVCEQK